MMKKLFTLLVLLVAIVTGAQAQESVTKTYTFDDNVALATDWDVTTDVPSGGTANCVITNSLSDLSPKAGNFLGLSYLNKGNIGITVTTTASYDNISEISIDAIANDNSKPTFAAYIVTETGDVEVFAAVGSKDGFATGGTKKWGNKTVTLASPVSGKLKIVTFASSSGKYAALDNIKITYSEGTSDTRTNLVGAWSDNGTSTFDYGSTATIPTFSVTGGTATLGTAYSVAYALTTDGGNVTVNSTSGITAIDTNTPGTSKVKATITVINTTDYKATTTEYETTITVNEEGGVTPAGGKYTITFNGKDEGDTDYFTNVGKHSFNTKFTGATYDGKAFTSGLKMESSTEIDFTTTAATSIVTIVQSTWSDTGIEFDGNTVASSTATAGTGYRVYTFTNVAAGSHSMKRGSASESGIFQITVEEIAATNAPVITVDPASAEYATGATADALTVSATASAGNLSYQWYSNTTASNEGGTEIAEATSANYTPSTATAGTYYYYVVVSDDNGSATSKVATITVVDASAPTSVTISGAPTAAVVLNQVVNLTATVEGAVPDATVDWLDESDNVLASATTTYTVPTTDLGEVKVKARATNESGSVSSELVTINVIDPNKTIEANEYFISVDEQVYPDEKITGTDIALTFVNGKAGESFTAGVSDNMISGENSNYVASISGSQSNNGWKAKFEPTANGILKVGVVINNNKTFSITPAANVTSFSYKGKNNADPQEAVEETVEGNSLTTGAATTDKIYVEVTLNVEANKEYSFSVAGSKMGFYGFNFTPVVDVTLDESNNNATTIAAANGKTANVTVERNLSTSYYNTLFLPFDMSAEQIKAAFGEGAQVATFVKMNSETQFGFGNVTEMEANVPYLVKPTQEVNGFTVEGVTISNTAVAGVVDGGYSMVGTYDTFTNGSSTSGGSIGGGISIGGNIGIGGGSSSTPDEIYYFATTGKIKKLTSTGSIKGLRAFMVKLPAGKTSVETIVSNAGIKFGGGSSGQGRARQNFVLNLDDDNTTTGINSIDNSQLTIDNDAPAYNLAGQKVGKGYKGIVIINGKKVVK